MMESIIKSRSVMSTPNGTSNPAMVRVTSEQATLWLEMAYEHQRTVRQRHVEFLAEEMRRDQFVQGTQIRFVSLDGRRILVDGQHRLWAVVMSGIPQYFSVLVTRAESDEDVAWIYGNLDVGLKRIGADLYGALKLENEFRLTKTQLSAFSSTINFLASGLLSSTQNTLKHRDDVVKYMRLYAPYAKEYFELTNECEKRIGVSSRRSATMSIALLTLRFSVPYAESRGDPSVVDFWRGVVFDNGVKLGDARKLANRHLLNARTIYTAAQSASGDVVSPAYSSRYLAAAFNAYMHRRELKMIKVLDSQAPLRLYGVPNEPDKWW